MAMSVQSLREVLERSLEQATPFTRRIFAGQELSAERVQDFINQVITATVATVRPDGRPHAAWVLCACLEGEIYITVSKRSVLLRNLRAVPLAALTVVSKDYGVLAEGKCVCEGEKQLVLDLLHRLDGAVERGRFAPTDWEGYIYRFDIERIFAGG